MACLPRIARPNQSLHIMHRGTIGRTFLSLHCGDRKSEKYRNQAGWPLERFNYTDYGRGDAWCCPTVITHVSVTDSGNGSVEAKVPRVGSRQLN